MRILWIGPWLSSALSTQVRGSMARALHDAGNEVGAVVIGKRGSWQTGGYDFVHYIPVPRSSLGRWSNQVRMGRMIAGFRGDVVVLGEKAAHLSPIASLARAHSQLDWSVVIDVRTLPIPSGHGNQCESREKRFWKQLKIGFRFADAWMAITERLREAVQERIDTRGLPCEIWESAVDRHFLENNGTAPYRCIAECGHKINILYLGSMSRGRRLDVAIKAMRDLNQREQNVGFHIVGSGDHLSELKQLVRELCLMGCVHFWNVVPYSEVPSVILACDLGILPLPDCEAWNTSSALKLYEYMGVGRPVLVSDIPAHRDAVGGRPFAFFMGEYSAQGFCAALRRFLAYPQCIRRELGQQAREFVRNNHTWDHRAGTIYGFLQAIHQHP